MTRSWLYVVFAAGLVAIALAFGRTWWTPAAPRPPCAGCNVLLISADTLRGDHLGTYGYSRDTSPQIDALASDAWVFLDATAPAPWTLATHVSLMTGLYPSRHGVQTMKQKFDGAVPMLPELLHQQGYRTAGFTGGGFVSRRYGYREFDVWNESGGYSGGNYRRMLAWLRRTPEPFFLFYHDYQAHCPYAPPPHFDVFSDPGYDGVVVTDPRKPAGDLCVDHPARCRQRCGAYFSHIRNHLTAADFAHVVDKYDGEIRLIDHRVGGILALLGARGLRDRTVIVFTSDHGETFGRDGSIGHNGLYEEFVNIPLIIAVPGQPPRRSERPALTMDILPTVLDVLGMDVPQGLDGQSLLAPPSPDRLVISEHVQHFPNFAARRAGRKFIWIADADERELFDLEQDPDEVENLAGNGGPAERELLGILRAHVAAARPWAEPAESRVETTAEQEEQLRALGYAE